MYRQSEKNLLSSNIYTTCPYNMVNFGPLAAENVSLVWGTPANFNGFCVLAALLYGTLLVGVSQTAALNRGCHLYSAGRPSRWTLAHSSSFYWAPCVKLKPKDLESCLSRICLFYSITLQCWTWKHLIDIGKKILLEISGNFLPEIFSGNFPPEIYGNFRTHSCNFMHVGVFLCIHVSG